MFSCGYSMKMLRYFQYEDGVRGLGMIVKLYVPAVILVNIPYVPVSTDSLLAFLTSVLFAVLLFFAGRYNFRYFFSGFQRHETGQMQVCSIGSAVSLVGLPVVFSYYNESGLSYLLAYDVANTFVVYVGTYLCAEVYKPAVTDGVPEAISTDASLGDGLDPDAHSASHPPPVFVATPRMSSGVQTELSPPCTTERAIRRGPFFSLGADPSWPSLSGNAAPESEVDIEGASGSIRSRRTLNLDQGVRRTRTLNQLVEHVQARPGEIRMLLFGAIKQPTITAMCVGIIMRSASVTIDQLPLFVSSAARTIAGSCGYVTFFTLGIFFSPQVLLRSPSLLRRALACLMVRYACAIAVCVVIQFIPLYTARLRQVVGICVMMPVPPVVIALSALNDYDKEFSVVIVNASLLLSVFLSAGFALLMA